MILGKDADSFYLKHNAPVFPGQCKRCHARFKRGEIAYVVKRLMYCKAHKKGEPLEVPRDNPYFK